MWPTSQLPRKVKICLSIANDFEMGAPLLLQGTSSIITQYVCTPILPSELTSIKAETTAEICSYELEFQQYAANRENSFISRTLKLLPFRGEPKCLTIACNFILQN